VDCHSASGHPYATVSVPGACGHCHDAPGENTLRSHALYRERGGNRDCLDCHAKEGDRISHEFAGASRPGFLDGVAELRFFVRESPGIWNLLATIQHRAGHALPGGTTGRSVWLVISGLDTEENVLWKKYKRFGWLRTLDGAWLDKTLPPLESTGVEMTVVKKPAVQRIRAELIYRFDTELPPFRQKGGRVLATREIRLPR